MEPTELSWLAGIIDGEGNLHLGSKTATNGKAYLDIKIRVSNTDLRMLKKISEIYKKLNLRFHLATVNFHRKEWKNGLSINVASQGSSYKLLASVFPYLVNKKHCASIMLNILEHLKGFPKGGNTTSHNYFEDDKFNDLFGQFQKEKTWYFDPSTTTRKANSILEFDDIV